MKLDNIVVEVLNKEHGKKVIDFFKNKGVNTRNCDGTCNREDGHINRYYGIIDNRFSFHALAKVDRYNARIVTLEELIESTNVYPKVMWVSNFADFRAQRKRVVFAKKANEYIAWQAAETIEEAENVTICSGWKYAKDVEPEVSPIKELTMQEIADKFQIPVDNLRIKKQ